MSTQPKTIGSGLSLSNVRSQVDMLEGWLESLPTPAMIEVRATMKNVLSAGTHEVWHLVRIEDADVNSDTPEGRVYRLTHSTDEPSAGDPTADLTTSHAVARYLKAASSVTVLVPEPLDVVARADRNGVGRPPTKDRVSGIVRTWRVRWGLQFGADPLDDLLARLTALVSER